MKQTPRRSATVQAGHEINRQVFPRHAEGALSQSTCGMSWEAHLPGRLPGFICGVALHGPVPQPPSAASGAAGAEASAFPIRSTELGTICFLIQVTGVAAGAAYEIYCG